MAKYIPNWLHRGYLALKSEFGKREFSFQQALEFLQDDARKVNLLLAGLREHGWLMSKKNPTDKRKSIYQLKDLGEVYKELEKDVHVQARK